MISDLELFYKKYQKNGFVFPIDVIDLKYANQCRLKLEDVENKIGTLHYKSKIHTILTWVYKLATHNNILDLVEKILGPNILLHNSTFIIKEANTPSHVSWHQDLTYWGFSHDDQVSVWLALSPANELSGAMQMIPESYTSGMIEHIKTKDKNNVLLQGQKVERVNEKNATLCPLLPGEASFHHGWTLHRSKSNRSSDRRIGLNFQYLATHVKQTKHNNDSAICIRGFDQYNNFKIDQLATKDLDPVALEKFIILDELYKNTAGN
ncbi:phytanoyl-CoA dioxygenase family protein [Alphaproteobacteria bacterium]|nr:phytanoyl-CoA dioxygenase family protein [Alphaproteobacteria bacterium]